VVDKKEEIKTEVKRNSIQDPAGFRVR